MATSAKVLSRGRSIDGVPGSRRSVFRDITFSNSYATGGEALPSLQSLGLKEAVYMEIEGSGFSNAAGTSLLPVRYNRSTHKLQAYRYDGASAGKAFLEEVAAAVDLSTFSGRIRFDGPLAS